MLTKTVNANAQKITQIKKETPVLVYGPKFRASPAISLVLILRSKRRVPQNSRLTHWSVRLMQVNPLVRNSDEPCSKENIEIRRIRTSRRTIKTFSQQRGVARHTV